MMNYRKRPGNFHLHAATAHVNINLLKGALLLSKRHWINKTAHAKRVSVTQKHTLRTQGAIEANDNSNERVFLSPSNSQVIGKNGTWFKVPYERLDEPDSKTYYSTMYVRLAKTQVSLCIDPLYKASFLDSLESEEGAYCTISEGSDQNVMLQLHCLFRFGQPGYRR